MNTTERILMKSSIRYFKVFVLRSSGNVSVFMTEAIHLEGGSSLVLGNLGTYLSA